MRMKIKTRSVSASQKCNLVHRRRLIKNLPIWVKKKDEFQNTYRKQILY